MENFLQDSEHTEAPEHRLWRAVIASTVNEWVNGPLRKRREAEQFLLHDKDDYRTVCYSAGIDPTNLRERLQKIRSTKESEATAKSSQN